MTRADVLTWSRATLALGLTFLITANARLWAAAALPFLRSMTKSTVGSLATTALNTSAAHRRFDLDRLPVFMAAAVREVFTAPVTVRV